MLQKHASLSLSLQHVEYTRQLNGSDIYDTGPTEGLKSFVLAAAVQAGYMGSSEMAPGTSV